MSFVFALFGWKKIFVNLVHNLPPPRPQLYLPCVKLLVEYSLSHRTSAWSPGWGPSALWKTRLTWDESLGFLGQDLTSEAAKAYIFARQSTAKMEHRICFKRKTLWKHEIYWRGPATPLFRTGKQSGPTGTGPKNMNQNLKNIHHARII